MGQRKFAMIDIGITRACNMKCKFCTAVKTHEFDKMMSLKEFVDIFDKVESLIAQKKIHMYGKMISYGNVGEPLLNRSFIDMNKYVKKRGWKSGIYTNGLLLNEKKINEIYDNGGIDLINVSVTGVVPSVYKEFQGYGMPNVKRTLSVVLKNIEEVVKVRNTRRKHTKIAVNYIVTRGNILHIPKYVRYMKEIGIDEIRFTPLVDRKRKKKKYFVQCPNLDGILNIDEQGRLSPCNNDLVGNLVIGNIMKDDWFDSYQSIVNNNKCIDVEKLPDTCKVCDKTNFSSCFDYFSMFFHGYLEMNNGRILYTKSALRYWEDIKKVLSRYFDYRIERK